MSNSNKYGLILKDKSKPQLTFQASHNVFGNDSDSDNESKRKPILLRSSDSIKRQAKITQEKAVVEDPTVYQYDEIYDSMVKEKESKKEQKKEEKKPKYIENLMKSANKRKLENERRIERQIQKEREKEGDEFADKEVFVTTAYKKKLEELRLEEEKEKREEYLERIGDVTQQSDLGGFYRHLYEQKLGSDKSTKQIDNQEDKSPERVSDKNNAETEVSTKQKQNKQRNYRKRIMSSDKKLSDGEIDDSDDEIKFSNLEDVRTYKKSKVTNENIDADSDFSIDESSEDEKNEAKSNEKLEKTESENVKSQEPDKTLPTKLNPQEKPNNEVTEPKIKVDIWKKRTVGEVFEQALKRYYERKASRGA